MKREKWSVRVAVLLLGEPRNGGSIVETEGNVPYLGLLDWPSGRLLIAHPIGDVEVDRINDFWSFPRPVWSPDGQWLASPFYGGGMTLMDRSGNLQPVLTNNEIEWSWYETKWARWGANGYLALLIGEDIWLLHAPSR